MQLSGIFGMIIWYKYLKNKSAHCFVVNNTCLVSVLFQHWLEGTKKTTKRFGQDSKLWLSRFETNTFRTLVTRVIALADERNKM